jgi:hypothetical protein
MSLWITAILVGLATVSVPVIAGLYIYGNPFRGDK